MHDASSILRHDLRNCLYLAASFAALLQDGAAGPMTPAQQELLQHILTSTRKAQALLDGKPREGA